MAKITFYPLGNADSSLIEFADERLMLIDYFQPCKADDDDKRIDLADELRNVLDDKERDYFDVVAFTHRDKDHVNGAEDFFYLEHAEKYQDDNRIHIRELWVPACFILEEGLDDSSRVIRQEARHRLKDGKNIRVFGEPDSLKEWLEGEGIEPSERSQLITRAGECVDEFISKTSGGAEIFVHAPFKAEMENEEIEPNKASLVLHISFFEDNRITRVMFGGDTPHQIWDKIVQITNEKGRKERLIWDIFKVSHHCSYLSLSDDIGEEKTEPTKDIDYLFQQGQVEAFLVSSSKCIPADGSDGPPHRQAANYYKDVKDELSGEFLVTMEEPSKEHPEPIIISIDTNGPAREMSDGGAKVGGYTPRKEPSRPSGGRFA